MTTKYTVTNFYNNNLILIVYRWWSTKYMQWLLWLQYNILKNYFAKLTKPVACRPIATRWLSAKRLVVRNVLISHAPKLKSKMRTDAKSGDTRWLKTNVQSSYKLITGENYDDWVKSFPKNVKVDQHLCRFWRMSRWTLHLLAFCDESKGLQTLVKLLSTAHWGRLPLWE